MPSHFSQDEFDACESHLGEPVKQLTLSGVHSVTFTKRYSRSDPLDTLHRWASIFHRHSDDQGICLEIGFQVQMMQHYSIRAM